MSASKVVPRHIKDCVINRRMHIPREELCMAGPSVEVEPSLPFSYTEIDCFGPFYTEHGQRESRRCSLLCTCLSSTAINFELLENLTTDALLNALRFFIALSDAVRQIQSDKGKILWEEKISYRRV